SNRFQAIQRPRLTDVAEMYDQIHSTERVEEPCREIGAAAVTVRIGQQPNAATASQLLKDLSIVHVPMMPYRSAARFFNLANFQCYRQGTALAIVPRHAESVSRTSPDSRSRLHNRSR